jgi:hypothetical protein
MGYLGKTRDVLLVWVVRGSLSYPKDPIHPTHPLHRESIQLDAARKTETARTVIPICRDEPFISVHQYNQCFHNSHEPSAATAQT